MGEAAFVIDIFARLADVQVRLQTSVPPFRAHVATIEGAPMLVIEHVNPRRAWALLDAVGSVFGEAWVLDGCESCGFDSKVGVPLQDPGE